MKKACIKKRGIRRSSPEVLTADFPNEGRRLSTTRVQGIVFKHDRSSELSLVPVFQQKRETFPIVLLLPGVV